MSRIELKSLKYEFFRGLKDQVVEFSPITNILGENGSGKSTIFDSFTWLLFNKDSQDRLPTDAGTGFRLKTIDENGEVMHGLEHKVTGVILVDGKTKTLSKTYQEIWVKKRGEAHQTFTGNETLYYVNDVPKKKGEYEDIINGLINEGIFKLITNPMYFSNVLDMKERRKILINIIGDIDSETVMNYKPSLRPIEVLLYDSDMETLKASLSARKTKINNDIKQIKPKITECENLKKDLNFDELKEQLKSLEFDAKDLDDKITDTGKFLESRNADRERFYSLKTELSKLEHEIATSKVDPLEGDKYKLKDTNEEIVKTETKISNSNFQKTNIEKFKKALSEEISRLGKEYDILEEKNIEINPDEFACPTCKRSLPSEEIKAKKSWMIDNFNKDKESKLEGINEKGVYNSSQIDKYNVQLDVLEKDIQFLSERLDFLKIEKQKYENKIDTYVPEDEKEDGRVVELKYNINNLQKKIDDTSNTDQAMVSMKNDRSYINSKIDYVKKQLNQEDYNKELADRQIQLKADEKALGIQLAELEGQEFLCEEFIKTKVELMEGSINKKFKNVTFQLFQTQVNGAISETCEVMVKGVPYSSLNRAMQISSGIEIINVLCEHYDVSAPIWIDNCECINEVPETNSQLVKLYVTKDKQLKVE